MIRVLHVVQQMQRHGAETFIMNIYRNIDREKVQFDFLTHTTEPGDYDDEIRGLGGKIYSVSSRRVGIKKNKDALNEFFRKHTEYKIVHAHFSSCSYIEPLRAAKRYGVNTRILHSHSTAIAGNPIHKYIHYINRLGIEGYATDNFACSDEAGRWMFGDREFEIITNGVDTQKYMYNRSVREDIRHSLGISGKFCVGSVGRFVASKNHVEMLRIFVELKKKRSDAILILVGDGPLREETEKQSSALGVNDSVIFTGSRSDVERLMQGIDAFLMPSLYEGLPVTLVEAQSAGVPCVVSDTVTKQVALTDYIKYLDLRTESKVWAEEISKINPADRYSDLSAIKKHGFDINMTADKLENFYLERGGY